MAPPDTIAAIASAHGRGAVGVIRVSGPQVPLIGAEILGALPPPRHARFTRFLDRDGSTLDQGLALYFPAPDSLTGEHVLELQGHGGALILDMLLQRLLDLGCRMARPGEFSERAFLNGKMDIAQAEAVADLIDAGTAAAARAAVRTMQGEFSDRIHELQARITELRMLIEAAIDFPDEELDIVPMSAVQTHLATVFAAFDSIAAAAAQGALLREGLNVVIAGRPNAGKSSLLNKLVGNEVAIVADSPGTTRDVLRQHLHLDGLPLNLIDTAGLRTAADAVEAEGVRRAKSELTRADRVLYMLDGAASQDDAPDWAAELEQLPQHVPVTLLINKIDLIAAPAHIDEASAPPRIYLSAKTGAGLSLLRAHLKASVGFVENTGALSARRRHLDALRRARRAVEAAAENVAAMRGFELFAEDLRLAQLALSEITGELSSDDLLGEIFSSFCIGK